MSKNTIKKPRVPQAKVPIIGQQGKPDEFVRGILKYLDPILQSILNSIDGLERRVAVMEEVKQLFPQKIEVVIKKEEVKAWEARSEEKK